MKLLDVPQELWQFCIFEYWMGPIHQADLNHHASIMKFKKELQPIIINSLDLFTVKTIHTLCCLVSKKTSQLFMEMDDFWRRVSNILEMVIYWKRYESNAGLSFSIGDITVLESISLARMQKLIEATEMNSNREFSDFINPKRNSNFTIDVSKMKNSVNTEEMNLQFEKRIQSFMLSKEKLDKITTLKNLNSYQLFLHKALILSLDMIAYFDSEKFNGNYQAYDAYENCCLIAKGVFTQDTSDTKALGLMINMNQFDRDYTSFNQIASNYIAISIVLNEFNYKNFSIPDHIQYLCFYFGELSNFKEGASLYSDFLGEQSVFPNVRDLSIRMDTNNGCNYWENVDVIEKNIIRGITRQRFPKLLRLSLQGFSNVDNMLDLEMLSEIPYVEIISLSRDHNADTIYNWSNRRVHNLIKHHFIDKDSLIHHLVMHANIARNDKEADYSSIKEYYDLTESRFVASISHSSFLDYYNNSTE